MLNRALIAVCWGVSGVVLLEVLEISVVVSFLLARGLRVRRCLVGGVEVGMVSAAGAEDSLVVISSWLAGRGRTVNGLVWWKPRAEWTVLKL